MESRSALRGCFARFPLTKFQVKLEEGTKQRQQRYGMESGASQITCRLARKRESQLGPIEELRSGTHNYRA